MHSLRRPTTAAACPPTARSRVAVVVGNEDGAHHCAAEIIQALTEVGFTAPAGERDLLGRRSAERQGIQRLQAATKDHQRNDRDAGVECGAPRAPAEKEPLSWNAVSHAVAWCATNRARLKHSIRSIAFRLLRERSRHTRRCRPRSLHAAFSTATRASRRVGAPPCRFRGHARDHHRRKAERRRIRRNGARGHPRPDHRGRHPHVPVSAVQHPVRLDDGDAADRRLSVRLEIHLRLQPLLVPVLAAAVHGDRDPRHGARSAATWWCSACRATTPPTTSSA